MHELFKQKYNNWLELEAKIESISGNKEKGDAFEEFIYFYLLYHRSYYQIESIFCPVVDGKPFPKKIRDRLKLEKKDHGVDGVHISSNGALTAYQVKFRSQRQIPAANELSSFWAEAEYADVRCIIANASSLPRVSHKKKNHTSILVDRFELIDADFFSALLEFATTEKIKNSQKFKPRDYQEKMIDEIVRGFDKNDRGKLISACGSGKTHVALWVSEELKANSILFLAPSLALIRQTLEKWVFHSNIPFSYLCVCSDTTIGNNIEDEMILDPEDLDIPVSTSYEDVVEFLSDSKSKKVIFSTYQSLNVISHSLKKLSQFKFDLIIFDEAHRTAGKEKNALFSLGLDNLHIKAEKRLFMTATERLVRPKIMEQLTDAERIVFSMDDEAVYGPVLSKLTFSDAIKKKIVSDYRIVIAGVSDPELHDILKNNNYLSPSSKFDIEITADDLFKPILLLNVIRDLSIRKTITFHSRIKDSIKFCNMISSVIKLYHQNNFFIGNVQGTQNAAERIDIFEEFEDSDVGIISNVRCMSEGVDIPIIDAVYFADPKKSVIDIIQAVGRALRQPYGESDKIAYIIIPILVDENGDSSEVINSDLFETVYNVIQALRDQDEELAEWIDQINLSMVRGKKGHRNSGSGKIILNLPEIIDVEEFREQISVRIAIVNKNPTGTYGMGSTLGKKERISSYKRVFKTLGDYNIEPYSKMVIPTIEKFRSGSNEISGPELKINHNNVSHTERLGLIRKVENRKYELTNIGQMILQEKIDFKDVFMNQMLLYSVKTEHGILYPYRTAFRIIAASESLSYIEFLYGLYSINPTIDIDKAEEDAISMTKWIRKNYPNIQFTNVANQDNVREVLNSMHYQGFNANDVWTDRTTSGNQFRYLMRHLELFNDIFITNWKNKTINLTPTGKERIKYLLEYTEEDSQKLTDYGNLLWLRKDIESGKKV